MTQFLFGDFPEEFSKEDKAKIVLIPIPYDGTSTYVKGSDKGPQAIIEASYYLENLDIETGTEVYRQGIHVDSSVTEDSSPEEMSKAVQSRVSSWLAKDKFCVLLGGEHSITPGSVAAFAKKYQNLSVLQLDAHSDLRDEYHGSKLNHACAMARAQETCNVIQVGIRSMDISEKGKMKQGNVFFAKDIHDNDLWMDAAINKLTDQVYITIDLDVFDPSVMPSTGTPEPGGLYWYQVLAFLKKVAGKKTIVGFDVVELCPNESDKAPDFLAAKLIYTLLSYKFA